MKTANKIGIGACGAIAASAILSFGMEPKVTTRTFVSFHVIPEIALEWVGILLLIYAGIKGSRWWLVLPVGILSGLVLGNIARGLMELKNRRVLVFVLAKPAFRWRFPCRRLSVSF